jgi:DNA-binding beta-propeller fold protein YncE
VRIDKWPFFRAGLAVWIDLDSDVDFKLRPGDAVTAAEVSAGRTLDQIPAEYLKQLNDDDEVSVKAWVSLDGSNRLETATYFGVRSYRVRKSAGEIIREIVVGNGPSKIVIHKDGSRACVLHSGDSTVAVIDLSNYEVRTVSYPSTKPTGLALHPTDSRLFVSGDFHSYVPASWYWMWVLDTDTFVADVYVFTKSPTTMVGVSSNGPSLIMGYPLPYAVSASNYDARTYTAKHYYGGGGTTSPSAMTTDPLGAVVFMTGTYTARFNINDESPTHTTTNSSTARELAHSPSNAHSKRLYVSVSSSNKVDIYDTDSNRLALINSLAGISNPRGIAFHPIQPLAYVAELNNNRVRIIDTISETLVGTINGFAQPDGLACTPDGKTLLVCNSGNNTVAVVSI